MAERPRDTFLPGQDDGREFVDVPDRNMPRPCEPRPYNSPRWPTQPERVQITGGGLPHPREPKMSTANLPERMVETRAEVATATAAPWDNPAWAREIAAGFAEVTRKASAESWIYAAARQFTQATGAQAEEMAKVFEARLGKDWQAQVNKIMAKMVK